MKDSPPLRGGEFWRLLSILICAFLLFTGAQSSRQVEWLYYGGDQAGTKYSPLTDINQNNVQRLDIAWEWKHWETPLSEYDTTPGFFEATPLMMDGVLYVTTPYNRHCCRHRRGCGQRASCVRAEVKSSSDTYAFFY